MFLREYLDIDELEDCINDDFISVRNHDTLPLQIYNYTPKGTYSFSPEDWPEAMLKCRGLIVNGLTDEIVAFCQPKFWNLDPETHDEQGDFQTFDKMDGSMGIVFMWEGEMHIATRGSFHSEQADWANEFIRDPKNIDYFLYLRGMIEAGFTPHVEIIFNENRIVLEYEYEDLVLIGYQFPLRWFTPHDIDYNGYPGKVAEEYFFENWKDLASNRDNKEGYVVFYPQTGNKYKVKHSHYIELHRAIFNLTDRKIWEQLYAGTHHDFIAGMPNEFQQEISIKSDEFLTSAIRIQAQCIDIYFRWLENNPDKNRKDFAIEFKDHPLRPFLFMYWDRKSPEEIFKKALYSVKP